MKHELSDQELLNELKQRFDLNASMLIEQQNLITQLNEVNEKLLLSETLKSNFLSNIRNEINNPIAAVLELAKNISEGNLDVQSMQKFATLIYSEVFDLDYQLRNIFLSAEIEAGEAQLSINTINVTSFLKNCIDAFATKINKKNIQLSYKSGVEDELNFKTDAEKLQLIVSNIIGNAIQFNANGGEVCIESTYENHGLKIVIKDNGIGIKEEDIDKIYDRFHQIEEGSTKTYGGHGLGLSISKALLEIIDGTISVESKFGEGSTFTILLNELESVDGKDDMFSSVGNEFLFEQDEDDMLF